MAYLTNSGVVISGVIEAKTFVDEIQKQEKCKLKANN